MAFSTVRPVRASRGAVVRVNAIKSQTPYAAELVETAVSSPASGDSFTPKWLVRARLWPTGGGQGRGRGAGGLDRGVGL
jgi:hypothetical protein